MNQMWKPAEDAHRIIHFNFFLEQTRIYGNMIFVFHSVYILYGAPVCRKHECGYHEFLTIIIE